MSRYRIKHKIKVPFEKRSVPLSKICLCRSWDFVRGMLKAAYLEEAFERLAGDKSLEATGVEAEGAEYVGQRGKHLEERRDLNNVRG